MNGSVYPLRAPRGMRWCHWVNCHSPIEASLFNNSITHNDSSKYRHSKIRNQKPLYELKFIWGRVWRTLQSRMFRESWRMSGKLWFLYGEVRSRSDRSVNRKSYHYVLKIVSSTAKDFDMIFVSVQDPPLKASHLRHPRIFRPFLARIQKSLKWFFIPGLTGPSGMG